LTIPVSVASGERSLSELKLIKTRCSLSIEHEIAQNIDLKKLISAFSELKARKIKF
jgi:hypothetical protein